MLERAERHTGEDVDCENFEFGYDWYATWCVPSYVGCRPRAIVANRKYMASTVPRERKKYASVELKPLSAGADYDDEEEYKSKTDQWLAYILAKLHALLWIVIASFICAYTEIYEVILDGHPPHDEKRQLNR